MMTVPNSDSNWVLSKYKVHFRERGGQLLVCATGSVGKMNYVAFVRK